MLSAEDRAILDFERASWQEPGPKDLMIELKLGLSAAHYYKRLRVMLTEGEGYSYDPLTAKRVLRIIEQDAEIEQAVS